MAKTVSNELVIKTFFSSAIDTAKMTLSFSRRDIIEGYTEGRLPFDDIVSKMDLHSGFDGLKIIYTKEGGAVTRSDIIYIPARGRQ